MHIDMSLSVMRRLLAISALVLAGCTVDPLPEPPSAEPELVGEFHGETCLVCDAQGKLAGGPGSVESADSIWVVNLDGTEPPQTAPVKSDGSFELFVSALDGDEIRLQARKGDLRSEPIDLVMAVDGVLELAPRPLDDCFLLAPELQLPDTAVASSAPAIVRLEHTCDAPLSLELIGLRAPTPDFEVAAPGTPLVLASGEFVDVAVEMHPSAGGLREEVLLVEVSSPAVDRRAVTLFGDGIP
jgi:hypothetical protein